MKQRAKGSTLRRILYAVIVVVLLAAVVYLAYVGWCWLANNDRPISSLFAIVLAMMTGTLALVTYFLFKSTNKLASETGTLAQDTALLAQRTVESTILTDRHHQESLMPIVVFQGRAWSLGSSQPSQHTAVADGELTNIGLGPVLSCELSFGFGESFKGGPIGVRGSIKVRHDVTYTSTHVDEHQPFHLTLWAVNAFGQSALTEVFGKFGDDVSTYKTIYTPAPVVVRAIGTQPG